MDESEREEGFKVRDKRRFTEGGESKESADTSAAEESPAQSREEVETESSSAEPSPGQEQQEAPRPLDFSSFVLSLANTALFQMGFIRMSESDPPQKDLTGARQTIDIIALMEDKTRGNLTDQEKKLISETLFQLRMAFVEAAK